MYQTGKLRLDYADLAAKLKSSGLTKAEQDAVRDSLKKAFREKQTELGKAITKEVLRKRKESGHVNRRSNASKTNVEINAKAKVFKNTGRALAVVGVVFEVANIANAPEGERLEEGMRAGGRLAGGYAGAAYGAEVGFAGGPWGVAGGTFVGGFLGSIFGEGVIEIMCTDPSNQTVIPLMPWDQGQNSI